jgi:hypothetical protein
MTRSLHSFLHSHAATRGNTHSARGNGNGQQEKNDSQQNDTPKIMPTMISTPRKKLVSASSDQHAATEWWCTQLKEMFKPSLVPIEKMSLLATSANQTPSSMKCFKSRCQSLQMKSLDGFSNLQLGRYCFNLETEFSLQGFRNPRLKLASSLQTIFSK